MFSTLHLLFLNHSFFLIRVSTFFQGAFGLLFSPNQDSGTDLHHAAVDRTSVLKRSPIHWIVFAPFFTILATFCGETGYTTNALMVRFRTFRATKSAKDISAQKKYEPTVVFGVD